MLVDIRVQIDERTNRGGLPHDAGSVESGDTVLVGVVEVGTAPVESGDGVGVASGARLGEGAKKHEGGGGKEGGGEGTRGRLTR